MSEWIKCSERVPHEQDADEAGCVWICSPIGAVWLTSYEEVRFGRLPINEPNWYWMPTNLKKPEPPK